MATKGDSLVSKLDTASQFSEGAAPGKPQTAPEQSNSDDGFAAIEARLAAMELHIEHLIRTAPTLPDPKQQEECWNYARDVQREIRAAREQLRVARERSIPKT